MKSIWKVTRFLALAGMAALMFAPRAEATSIVVMPHFQSVLQGATDVTVDIEAVGFSPAVVGGWSFDLSFDPTILQGTNAVIDPGGNLGANSGELGAGFTGAPGVYDSFVISALPQGGLPAQTDPFTLAELTFTAIGTGLSPLTLSVVPVGGTFLSDDGGFPIVPTFAVNGCVLSSAVPGESLADTNIQVADPCGTAAAVPEPATFGLLATGLATVLARRRRKNQA